MNVSDNICDRVGLGKRVSIVNEKKNIRMITNHKPAKLVSQFSSHDLNQENPYQKLGFLGLILNVTIVHQLISHQFYHCSMTVYLKIKSVDFSV